MTSKLNLIRVRRAARIMKCADSHVYRLVGAGVFTKYLIGIRSYRLSMTEVLDYLESRKMRA